MATTPRTSVRVRSTINVGTAALATYSPPANPIPLAPGYSTAFIPLASSTVDGVVLNQSDRVLLSGQTTASENGLYEFNPVSGTPTLFRLKALDVFSTLASGIHVRVSEGASGGFFVWSSTGIAADSDRGYDYGRFDIDEFWLSTDPTTSDGADMLPAWKRAHDASDKNGIVTFYRRPKYFFSNTVDVLKGVELSGACHGYSNNTQSATRLQFRGDTSINGVRVVTGVPGYPIAGYSGPLGLRGLCVENLDSNTSSSESCGIVGLGAIHVSECVAWGWSAHGMRIVANVAGLNGIAPI